MAQWLYAGGPRKGRPHLPTVMWITFVGSGRPRRWRRRHSLTSPSGKGDTALAQRIFCSRKRRLHAVHRRNLLGHPGLHGHGAGGWHVLADGLESIATAVTATGTYSWQVSYDSTNAAQRDIPASCQETSSLTIANGGTVTSP